MVQDSNCGGQNCKQLIQDQKTKKQKLGEDRKDGRFFDSQDVYFRWWCEGNPQDRHPTTCRRCKRCSSWSFTHCNTLPPSLLPCLCTSRHIHRLSLFFSPAFFQPFKMLGESQVPRVLIKRTTRRTYFKALSVLRQPDKCQWMSGVATRARGDLDIEAQWVSGRAEC